MTGRERPLRFVAQHPRAILMTVLLLPMLAVRFVGEAVAFNNVVPLDLGVLPIPY